MQVNKVGEQKLFKQFGHFSLLVLLSGSILLGSSFSEFKKSQDVAFSNYKDARDKEFKNHLESQWSEYSAQKGTPLYEKPKPKNIIRTVEKPIKSVGPKISVHVVKPKEIINPEKEKVVKVTQKITKDIEFDFYGIKVGFNIDANIRGASYFPQNQKGISKFFDVLATSEYEYLITSIEQLSYKLKLNDWAKYLLVDKLSQQLFDNRDSKNIFNWFVLNKLGYSVKIGLSNRHIIVMHYSKKIIYSAPNYTFNNKKYYVISKDLQENSTSIYTYKKEYPDADKDLDLSLQILPDFGEDLRTKRLLSRQNGKEYGIKYSYNQNLIDFMLTYPQADYETFFNTPLEERTYDDIARGLKSHLDGLQASSAINFVLNFVQNAFVYETDSEQFGMEKVMFAQETLYFDKSDCEDRAILFSVLVDRIFKVAVIGVKYRDHMATGLYIPVKGDSVQSNGRKFVIADPTYVNANIGQSMPKYKSVIPDSFIVVKR